MHCLTLFAGWGWGWLGADSVAIAALPTCHWVLVWGGECIRGIHTDSESVYVREREREQVREAHSGRQHAPGLGAMQVMDIE